jgi:hypothetical protein
MLPPGLHQHGLQVPHGILCSCAHHHTTA